MEKLNFNDNLVINLHITDACNFRCKFCYAQFERTVLSLNDWKSIVDNITSDVQVKRFNIAGGEPLVAPYTQELIDYIHSLGIDCSIITNGYFLTDDFITKNIGKLSMIGISVDGYTLEDNILIGRCDIRNRTLSNTRLIKFCNSIHNAGIKLKINTVANFINYNKDFTELITELKPERWKILRMTSFTGINDNQNNLKISDKQFALFIKNHLHLSPVIEDNEDIVHCYIVVNPQGQLVDTSNDGYKVSKSLLTYSFATQFAQVGVNIDNYMKRYQQAA